MKEVYGRHKQGFLVPLLTEVVIHIASDYRLFFAVFMRKNPVLLFPPMHQLFDALDVMVLLSNEEGTVLDASLSVFETFGIPLTTFFNREITVDSFFDIGIEDEDEL